LHYPEIARAYRTLVFFRAELTNAADPVKHQRRRGGVFDMAPTGSGEVAVTPGNLDIRTDACSGEAGDAVDGKALLGPATELLLFDKKFGGKMERHVLCHYMILRIIIITVPYSLCKRLSSVCIQI